MKPRRGRTRRPRSGSQLFANSVIASPSPPAQSPTTTRVKPMLGCSARHASTILSSAALVTAYTPSPGHGGVSDALTDDKYAATPPDAARWGSAAAVIERGTRDVGVERLAPRCRVGVDERRPTVRCRARRRARRCRRDHRLLRAIAARHEASSVASHAIASVPGPASLAASSSRSRRRASSAT